MIASAYIYRRMPALLGLLLVTLFIWFAENIGTLTRAWAYPNQLRAWAPVGPGKIGAWYLLMLISYTLVTLVSGVRDVSSPALALGPRPRNLHDS